jgi:hypothetical protein
MGLGMGGPGGHGGMAYEDEGMMDDDAYDDGGRRTHAGQGALRGWGWG